MNRKILNERKNTILEFMKDPAYRAMRAKDMATLLGLSHKELMDLHIVLDELVEDGKISISKRGTYRIAEPEFKTGTFRATTGEFGFVSVEGMEKDIFIPGKFTEGAFDQDLVEVQITRGENGDKSAEGRITKILDHGIKKLTGIYERSKNFGFVIPDNKKFGADIYINKKSNMSAPTGSRVVVELTDYGDKYKSPSGQIIEILGKEGDALADTLAIIRSYDIPEEFPTEVLEYVKTVPDHVSEETLKEEFEHGRMDFRDWQTVTIDGEDAKDLDDAVTLTFEDGIYHLGVHIADVTHYVRENNPLDKEALARSTSVYLADRVIPMLPRELSNGICSLNAGVDRLTLSCLMDFDLRGNLVSHQITEGVICVDRRMSYTGVQACFDQDPAALAEYQELLPMFDLMKELSQILRKKRKLRGSLDFEFPESKVKFDEDGHVKEIVAYTRSDATDLIEDFMLAANECVAENYNWLEAPFLYRVHEEPDGEKLIRLAQMIASFGYGIKTSQGGKEFHPKEFQKLLAKVADTPEEAFISRAVLRSMKQAKYSTKCLGHFGLAARYYCHFTSPIRRYPDLQIHRIIKEYLHGLLDEVRSMHYHEILEGVAKQTSSLERRAESAERDTIKLKMAEYMSDRIGMKFTGMVTSITDWGMYVELPNTIEGLVRLDSMAEDYYQFDKNRLTLTGRYDKREYHIGSYVDVIVSDVNMRDRTIDFVTEETKKYLEKESCQKIITNL